MAEREAAEAKKMADNIPTARCVCGVMAAAASAAQQQTINYGDQIYSEALQLRKAKANEKLAEAEYYNNAERWLGTPPTDSAYPGARAAREESFERWQQCRRACFSMKEAIVNSQWRCKQRGIEIDRRRLNRLMDTTDMYTGRT